MRARKAESGAASGGTPRRLTQIPAYYTEFPKGIKKSYIDFNKIVKPDGLNLDYEIDPIWAKKNLNNVVLQGGLDPKILFLQDEEINKNTIRYLSAFKEIPYIFNLGHGLLPETDPNKLGKLIKFYREYK